MALVAGLVGVLLAIFITIIAAPGLIPESYREKLIDRAPVICTLYAGFIVYELAARAAVGRRLRLGVARPARLAYLNAAIEVSLPTVLIVAASHVLTPLEALSIPPVFAYPILIMLLTLQLNPRVCAIRRRGRRPSSSSAPGCTCSGSTTRTPGAASAWRPSRPGRE